VRFTEKGKGPIAKGRAGDSFWHDGQKWVQRTLRVDIGGNHYFEMIFDPESGQVIHLCNEPLNQHIGHGGAKKL